MGSLSSTFASSSSRPAVLSQMGRGVIFFKFLLATDFSHEALSMRETSRGEGAMVRFTMAPDVPREPDSSGM